MFRTVATPRVPHVKNVLVCFLVGSDDDKKLREALPGWAILATDQAPLSPTETAVKASVYRLPGVTAESLIHLCGFSAGCQSVRSLMIANPHAWAGAALFDGTHADVPEPKPFQIKTWKDLADRARRGETRAIFTCTMMSYTKDIRDNPATPAVERPFMPTKDVLALALGAPLEPGKPVQEGNLYAEAFPSKAIDTAAHMYQQNEAMPALLAACWGDDSSLLDYFREKFRQASDVVGDLLSNLAEGGPDAWRDPAIPFGQRCVLWSLIQVRHDVKEDPLGSNDGPEIRRYFADVKFTRKTDGKEKAIRVTKTDWCAAGACYAHQVCAVEPGEPHLKARLSGLELESDAQENGTWVDVEDERARVSSVALGRGVQIGDLCILRRGGDPTKPEEAWKRHVCRVVTLPDKDGAFTTVGGNEDQRWKVTPRNLKDKDILGFVPVS